MNDQATKAESKHKVEIETVAEVTAVERQAVGIAYLEDERVIQLSYSPPFGGELQFISFPLAASRNIIAALTAIADAEGAPPADRRAA